MIITDAKKIKDIQEEFSNKFENLKLEFYTKSHDTESGSPADQMIDPEQLIGDIRTVHKSGDLSINGHLKVSTLEQHFRDDYGLNVQVFRKSGDVWLQTTSTDEWTLAEQDKRGKV